jgi:hypothetical protein
VNNFEEQLRTMRGRRRYPATKPHTDFSPEPRTPRWLWLVMAVAALSLAALILSYAATIPPAHLIIALVPISWIAWHLRPRRKRN